MEPTLVNSLGKAEATDQLTRCCGSHRWVEAMLASRPFRAEEQLFERADEIWRSLGASDWKEAFSHHPKIGDLESLQKKFATTSTWASGEQKGVQGASNETLMELKTLNEKYEQKFGYIFIVCATGKTADEMLAFLKQRINNDPDSELKIAAEEQRKITRIRLEKLCREVPSQPTS